MTLEEKLIEQLTANPELSALISNRVYPLLLPQHPVFPAVTLVRTDGERVYTFDGVASVSEAIFEFSAWSTKYLTAKSVADELTGALHSCMNVDGIEYVSISDGRDEYFNEIKLFQVPLTVTVKYTREVS